ncbi:zf-TFIIB domain-containing protein [Defluviimonas sp. SAOS-178_SWC]|uniref:TFIIB-type zinc ribbon-containing protein n=1 Tax=Defluviimonas sp. SAOS-178_SWC TaxID=3121287 RepID=UPI0032213F11
MKCPVDNTTLVMADRNGVEIDYCPSCRGVWLDRGELDKIIDRSTADAQRPVALSEPARASRDERRHRDDDDDRRYSRKKRRESFLSELFDF